MTCSTRPTGSWWCCGSRYVRVQGKVDRVPIVSGVVVVAAIAVVLLFGWVSGSAYPVSRANNRCCGVQCASESNMRSYMILQNEHLDELSRKLPTKRDQLSDYMLRTSVRAIGLRLGLCRGAVDGWRVVDGGVYAHV